MLVSLLCSLKDPYRQVFSIRQLKTFMEASCSACTLPPVHFCAAVVFDHAALHLFVAAIIIPCAME